MSPSILLGYMIVSNQVMLEGKPVKYLYREEPDEKDDSGWRIFSGEETQEYADNPKNFCMYNASTVVNQHPSITQLLAHEQPIAFELDSESGLFVEIEDSNEANP